MNLFFLIFSAIRQIATQCNFDSLENSLLPDNNPLSQQIVQINSKQFGVGFWSKYSVYKEYDTSVYYYKKPYYPYTGQLLLSMTSSITFLMVYLSDIDSSYAYYTTQYISLKGQSITQQMTVPLFQFEGKWILQYFDFNTVDYSLLIIISDYQYNSQSQRVETYMGNKYSGKIEIYLGGSSVIPFVGTYYSFEGFQGQMSKLILIEEPLEKINLLQQLIQSKQCQVINECSKEISKELLHFQIFNGENSISTQSFLYGSNYIIRFWIKVNVLNLSQITTMMAFRATTNPKYIDNSIGDRSFLLIYSIDFANNATTIQVSTYYYYKPVLHSIYFGDVSIGNNRKWFSEYIQYWHYISFYQEITDLRQQATIYFPKQTEESLIFNYFGFDTYRQFSSTMMYFYIGEDKYHYSSKFQGSIAHAYFHTCNQDVSIDIQTCHETCKGQCMGPEETDCYSCYENQHRFYLPIEHKCECLKEYFYDGIDYVCKQFDSQFSLIVQSEIEFHQEIALSQCPITHNQNTSILCLECIRDQENWLNDPICKTDYIKYSVNVQQSPYYLQERNTLNFEQYYVNQYNQIELCFGCIALCSQSDVDSNCHLSNYTSINGANVYIKCKDNYYFSNGLCQQCPKNCNKCSNDGICQECSSSFYLHIILNSCIDCPIECKECQLNEQQQIICTACLYKQTLYQGQCYNCGKNCNLCKLYSIEVEGQLINFVRCLRCDDEQKYFISFDAVNCLENEIPYCLYAFHYVYADRTQTTLDWEFTPRALDDTIRQGCARCAQFYLYVFDETANLCMRDADHNCHFHILDEKYSRFVNIVGETESGCENPIEDLTLCLQDNYPIVHCRQCVYSQKYLRYKCSLCDVGYYPERINGICLPCAISNCKLCQEQQKINKDQSILYKKAFYQYFVNYDGDHEFEDYAQSKNKDDYEVVCVQCQVGYELIGGLCVKQCPRNCESCDIVNQQIICTKCQFNQEGQPLTLYNGECIKCPTNCALCKQRSLFEIVAINPYFDSEIMSHYSNLCILPYSNDSQQYYDQHLKQYIKCDKFNECYKKWFIQRNIICSDSAYDNSLNSLNTDQQRVYKQNNVKLSSLFSSSNNSHIEELENDIVFDQANSRQIQEIVLQYNLEKQNECVINSNSFYHQLFTKNIFTLRKVALEIIGNEQAELIIKDSLSFYNFTQISLKNINFRYQVTDSLLYKKTLLFDNIVPISVYIENCNFYQESTNNFYIQFNNSLITNLTNVEMKLNLSSDEKSFITISQPDYLENSQSYFSDVRLINSQFSGIQLIKYNSISPLYMNKWQIQAKFTNSQLLAFYYSTKQESFQYYQTLSINDFLMEQSQIIDTHFIDCSPLLEVIFNNSSLQYNTFVNAIFIGLNYKNTLNNFTVTYNDLSYSSKIFNLINTQNAIIQMTANQLSASNNHFSDLCSLLYLEDQMQQGDSSLEMKNINLSNNTRLVLVERNSQEMNSPLFSLNSSQIYLENFTIARGIGITEFHFLSTYNITIINFDAYLLTGYHVKGLHQFGDCISKNSNINKLLTIIYFLSPHYINMKQIKLHSLMIVNSPLILYERLVNEGLTETQTIIFQDWMMEDILLLSLKQQQNQMALFTLTSDLPIQMKLDSLRFSQVHLNQYAAQQKSGSSASFSIICRKCKVSLMNSQFNDNLITNSTDPLMYLIVESFELLNSQIKNNNILRFDLIEKNLYFGFKQNTITNKQLDQLFTISSKSMFEVTLQSLIVQNCTFNNIFGVQGVAFRLSTVNLGKISINSCNFTSTYSGGCIYIDSSSSELELSLNNNIFNYVRNIKTGGVVHIEPSLNSMKINIQNIAMVDCQGYDGVLIYSQQSESITTKSIVLTNITISATKESFQQFLGELTEFSDSILSDLAIYRFLISISQTKLILNKIFIQNLYFQKLLYSRNSELTIRSLFLIDSQAITNVFDILNDKELQPMYLNDFQINNITTIFEEQQSVDCTTRNTESIQMVCTAEIKEFAVIDSEDQDKTAKCRFENITQAIIIKIALFKLIIQDNAGMINIRNGLFSNIVCKECQHGLFFVEYQNGLMNTNINNIQLFNNDCGINGCLSFIKTNNSSRRLLLSLDDVADSIKINLKKIFCSRNVAQFGTCLTFYSLQAVIESSIFSNNQAIQKGGALYISGNASNILLLNNQFINNSAQDSLNIYSSNSLFNTKVLAYNLIFNDQDKRNSVTQLPQRLLAKVNELENLINNYEVVSNDQITIHEINSHQIMNSKVNLYYPSGIAISKYKIYVQDTQKYIDPQYNLELFGADQLKQIFDLSGSTCQIKSRSINLTKIYDLDVDFIDENLINLQSVEFNSSTLSYQLDNLTVYYNPNEVSQLTLQIQFYCNAIYTPLYSEDIYQPSGYHNNYYYRIHVRTLPCQLGEYQDDNKPYCQQCDATQKFFSVKKNATSCELQNSDIISNIISSNFELKPGFWRQAYSNTITDQCINKIENCLGGWKYGDDSCYQGHIGALCEECDIYNVRGSGQFSTNSKYICGECSSIIRNIFILIGVTSWTLLSVCLTVKATYDFSQSLHFNRKIMKIALLLANENCQGAILIKFLSNYFQIVGALSSFQLSFPQDINYFIITTGNPVEAMFYSLDCVLANLFEIDIVYSKILWELMIPVFYIFVYLLGYIFLLQNKRILYKQTLIFIGIIYIYIFQQPNLIGSLISVISYREVDGIRWIQGHMSYQYDNPNHYYWVLYFTMVVLIIGVVIPLIIYFLLYRVRNNLNVFKIRKMFGYLYNEYYNEVYYWELAKLIFKDFIIISLVLYQDKIFMKAILIYLILQIQIYFTKSLQPYRLNYLNKLEEKMLTICQLSIILGYALSALFKRNNLELEIPFILVLAILNIYFLFGLLLKLIKSYTQKFEEQLNKIKDLINKFIPSLGQKFSFFKKLLTNRTEQRKRAKQNFRKVLSVIQHSNLLSPQANQNLQLIRHQQQ